MDTEPKRLTFYNKLVRDGMPDIIREDGHRAGLRTLDEAEFRQELKRKLTEEVGEYLASDAPEELADIWAVLSELALIHFPFSGLRAIADLAEVKTAERGGFDKRLFLLYVERPEVGREETRDGD